MKIWSAIFSGVLAVTLMASGTPADAKRLGGGSSIGKQSSNVTQRQATPPAPANTGTNATNSPAGAPGAAAPAAAAPKKPWGAMLGGVAAGLGLAWLASSLGLGEAFGQIILFGLLALVIMVVAGLIMRKLKARSAGQSAGGDLKSPFAFQGAGASPDAAMARNYSPANVGNDASARPWERSGAAFDGAGAASGGSMIGSALSGSQSWGVPADFDAEGFLKACKANFVTLQDAWDRSDIQSLRAMMTDEMLEQIKSQLAERETQAGGTPNKTEVVMLDAKLLGIEELSDVYMASVEFSGMIKEDASAGPSPFREVWNMTKPRNGSSGWLVAGVQALQ